MSGRVGRALAQRLFGLAALAVMGLSGCATSSPDAPPAAPAATRDDLFVLLPAQDGKTGALEVEHGGTRQVLDAPYAAARIKVEGRLETSVATEGEIKQVFGETMAALPARPTTFILHFVEARDELTPDSRQVLRQIVDEIAKRPAPELEVVGHTDRVGTVPSNDRLSLRRAERARDELAKLGVAADLMQVSGRGEREPLVPTADEVAEPKNRRVEVTIR